MLWHILSECKAAQDHLQIMNHDNFGSDEVQKENGSRQQCHGGGQGPINYTRKSRTLKPGVISKDMNNTISFTVKQYSFAVGDAVL